MRTAGVVIDFHDDSRGEILREMFPTTESLPEIVKTSFPLGPEERASLRDDAFALILRNDGTTLRKFACVDAGNTLLSALYLSKTAHRLPEEAVKVAWQNIAEAADRYGATEELLKLSGNPLRRTRDPESEKRNKPAQGGWADRTNTPQPGYDVSERTNTVTDQYKTASHVPGHHPGVLTDEVRAVPVTAKAPDIQRRTKPVDNHVPLDGTPSAPGVAPTNVFDATGKKAQGKRTEKKSSVFALEDRYPLDTYADVQAAVRYFDDYGHMFDPADRHEYAVKTAARAAELGIPTSQDLDRYGSTEYSPDLDAHLSMRVALAPEGEIRDIYEDLRTKTASIAPEEMAHLVGELDSALGFDSHYSRRGMSDPYWAVFGGSSNDKLAGWSWTSDANDTVNAEQLQHLARNGRKTVHKQFSSEIADEFMKDPVGIFDSLPADHKKILARMAIQGEHVGPLN